MKGEMYKVGFYILLEELVRHGQRVVRELLVIDNEYLWDGEGGVEGRDHQEA